MLAYFVAQKDSAYFATPVFHGVMIFVQKYKHLSRIKEQNDKLMLAIEEIDSISKAMDVLEKMDNLIAG